MSFLRAASVVGALVCALSAQGASRPADPADRSYAEALDARENGRRDVAAERAAAAAAFRPEDAALARAAALFEHEAGRSTDALRRLAALLDVRPNDREAAALRAKIFWERGDLERARDVLAVVDRVFGATSEESRMLAIADAALADPVVAEARFRAADPNRDLGPDALARVFESYLRNGRPIGAVSAYESSDDPPSALLIPYLSTLVALGRSSDARDAAITRRDDVIARLRNASSEVARFLFELSTAGERPETATAEAAAARLRKTAPTEAFTWRASETAARLRGDAAAAARAAAIAEAFEGVDARGNPPVEDRTDFGTRFALFPGLLRAHGENVPLGGRGASVKLRAWRAASGSPSAIVTTATPGLAASDLRRASDALVAAGFTRVTIR